MQADPPPSPPYRRTLLPVLPSPFSSYAQWLDRSGAAP
jgi:hypothetical protein